ncbi:PAS domain S-box-containing protein [Haladaptatus litoreus]|uniref:PAS domain S-box-containing protein n=1 Tax=Haladaptatus litoreus TaxID=553468 RepID=A0A1N7CTH8_9EURY|nr:PAS domain S-box protein [Haladaptatus litoreus]SIR66948.1 PAS domain S-box-containing protein [Haladaptatus litoreus]
MPPASLTTALRETLALFNGGGPPQTTNEVADQLNLGQRSTYSRLKRLVEHNRLETKKVGASARVWWQPQTNTDTETPGWQAAAKSLIDDADASVFVFDSDWQVKWINDTAEQYFELDHDQIVGQDKQTLLNTHLTTAIVDSESFTNRVQSVTAEPPSTEQFKCHVTAGEDREERWLEYHTKPIETGVYTGGHIDLYYDITDRKQTEQVSEGSNQRYSTLIHNLPGMVYRCRNEPKWPMEFVSSACTDITGYDVDAIESGTVSWGDDVVHPDDRGQVWEAVHSGLNRNGKFTIQYRIQTADDNTRWVRERGHILSDTSDSSTMLEGIITDITAQKMTELELRERDLEDVVERMDDGFVALDENLRFTYVNDRAGDLLKRLPDELVGRHITDAFEPDPEIEAAITDALETEKPTAEEVFYEPLETWFEFHLYPTERGLSVYFEDVTERKEQTQQLEQYERVVETIDDGIYVLDSDHRFTMVNSGFTSMTEYGHDELIGAHAEVVFGDDLLEIEEARQTESELGNSPVSNFEEDISTASGSSLTVANRFTLFKHESGEIGRVGVVRDVTERKKRERELERYAKIIDAVGEPVYELDAQGRVTFVNEPLVERTGYEKEELLGQHVSIGLDKRTITEAESKIADLFADGANGTTTLEYELVTKNGERIPAENRISLLTDEDGGIRGSAGVVWDMSDRVERERELERQIQQQRVVTELGKRALEDRDIDMLLADAAEQVADTLNNDYAKILELDTETNELRLRQGVGWNNGLVGSATISAVADDSQAAYILQTSQAVVVSDFETESRFSGPERLTNHDVRSGISTIIGPVDDPWGIFGTHDTAPQEFSDHDVNFVQSVANILAEAIARRNDKQQLRRQREQLAALNNLNKVVRDITDAAIEQSTRKEIETIVCEQLAAVDSYDFAWIGDVDDHTETVNLRTEAGVEGYLDDITISVDPADERSNGPTGRAILQRDIQTAQDVLGDASYEPWRDSAREYGFRSSAAIPIQYEKSLYGVLNVYSTRPNAFTTGELEVIGRLGDIVGHAIASVERKRALMSDEVIELEFQLLNVFEALDADATTNSRITLDRAVPTGDATYLVYGTTTNDGQAALEALIDQLSHWDSITVLDDENDIVHFELLLTDPPVLSTVASQGGYVDMARIENGNLDLRLHLAPSGDARAMTDTVLERYPGAELRSQRQITRTDDAVPRLQQLVRKNLTDRQQTVLEAAYHAGFFEWPRTATGEDIADSLSISSPTFHQHLRKAEHRIFTAILETSMVSS